MRVRWVFMAKRSFKVNHFLNSAYNARVYVICIINTALRKHHTSNTEYPYFIITRSIEGIIKDPTLRQALKKPLCHPGEQAEHLQWEVL